MVPFKKVCARFFLAAAFALLLGLGFVEAASAADTPPAPPEQLWLHEFSKNDAKLSWPASNEAESYDVYVWEYGDWQPVAEISETIAYSNAQMLNLDANVRLIEISGLECGINYQYVVTATNEKGQSGQSPSVSFHTILCDPINVPQLIAPSSGMTFTTSQGQKLQWQNGSQDPVDRYYYEVYGPRGLETSGLTIYTEVEIWWLPPGNYRWKVQAERRGIKGEWSDEWDFTIFYYEDPNLSVPLPIWPANGQIFTNTSQVELDWIVANEDSVGSWLELYGTGDFLRTVFVTDTKSIQQSLEQGEYSWRTRYVTDYLMSYWSESFSFTIVEPSIPNEVVPVPTITAPVSGTIVVTDEAVLLEWKNVNVDGYNVEVEGKDGFLQTGFITGTSTVLQFAEPGIYLAKVQAVRGNDLSEWSDKVLIFVDASLLPVIDCNTWTGGPALLLFSAEDCRGAQWSYPKSGQYNLSEVGFEDITLSIFVPAGKSIRVYSDASLQGFHSCYNVSMWKLKEDLYWETEVIVGNTISSIEVFDQPDCPSAVLPPRRIVLLPVVLN